MNPGGCRWRRRVQLLLLALPLLNTGTCVQIAQRTLVNAFFEGVSPVLVEQLAESLGSEPGASDPNQVP